MQLTSNKVENTTLTVKFLNKKSFELLNSKTLTNSGFTAKNGDMVVEDEILWVGTQGIKTVDDWRILGYKITTRLTQIKVSSASIKVPKKCSAFLEGLKLGGYTFDKYKSKPEVSKLDFIDVNSNTDISEIMNESVMRVNAQCLTRDWVNTTPEEANSISIEASVRKMFEGTNITVNSYWGKSLEEFGMNGHLAVNRASRHEACTIRLTYTPEKFKEHHVFIGKGLSYDSGGLSIKPSTSMTTMKMDKAGAMTVWGMMSYLSEIGCKHKVTAYMCIAENMIDGSAYKPDDVLVMKNGKTVHIKNTDAEGRLVLFDNICLAQEQNDDITTIHTLATLTGSAVIQFGAEAAGLVGFNDKLKDKLKRAGDMAGEIFLDAAFHKYMMDGVEDTLSDLSNTGTKNMGCQKAGLFLTYALEKKNRKKYLHWDIAGPAYAEKPWGTNIAGGTGFGVRTLIEFLQK